jgi:hypothetical protein
MANATEASHRLCRCSTASKRHGSTGKLKGSEDSDWADRNGDKALERLPVADKDFI